MKNNLIDFPFLPWKIMARFAGGVFSKHPYFLIFKFQHFSNTDAHQEKRKNTLLSIILKLYDTQDTLWNFIEQIEKAWNDPFFELSSIWIKTMKSLQIESNQK